MKSCTCASPDSPTEAPRPSFHDCDEPKNGTLAPRRLARKPSKLQTTVEVTRCRFGTTSRQAAPIGYEDFIPQRDWKPIFHAVYHDREGALHHFLQTGVSPDDTEGTGIPLLAIAAACGHFEIAKILLEAGAYVNAASRDKGETALHVAVKGGRHDIIDLLLEHRANLEARTIHTGETALHYAAKGSGSLALVMKLLKFGAKYDVQSLEGLTPATVALQRNNLHAAVAIINMACGKPKQLIKEKDMLLQHVEKTKDRSSMTNDLIADVFAATCDPDSTVLVEAIKKNDARLVEMFLEKGADPHRTTAKGLLPILVAVKFADLRIIKMLVQHGADVTVQGPENLDTLQGLFEASSTRDEESIVSIADYLLAKGADGLALCSDGKTYLHRTVNASADRAKVVKLLLKNGIKVNAQDKDGNTALHHAASNGLIHAARVMLDAHADTTIVNSEKRTPLLHAVRRQQWPVVQMLALPPAITSWDAEGSTALHHIARSTPKNDGSWKDIAAAAKPFCERGICRSMRDRSGATPLIQAIRSLPDEGLPVVQALLAEGDQKWNCVGHEDHNRRDALYYAATLGKPAFVEVLLEHGAPFALKDWTDSKRQFKLPAASKHRIMELLIETDCSREALKSLQQHSPTKETHIEIIRTEPRTSSALSGYGADCEAEGKSKPNRSTPRKAPSAQHLQVPTPQRKPAAVSPTLPARTTSKQQRSRGATAGYHRTVHHLSSVSDQAEYANTRTKQPTQCNNQRGKATNGSPPGQGLPDAITAFPTRASSRQQVIASIPVDTFKLNATVRVKDTTPPQREVGTPSTMPTAIAAKCDATPKAPQTPPKPHKASVESIPLVTRVTAANNVEFAAAPLPPPAKMSTTTSSSSSSYYVASTTAELVKAVLPSKPSSAASDVPAGGKPVQPARVDSGVSMTPDNTTATLPTLDRTKPTLDGSTPTPKRQSGDELASWLAISSILDRL